MKTLMHPVPIQFQTAVIGYAKFLGQIIQDLQIIYRVDVAGYNLG